MNIVLRPATPTDAGATGDILWQFINDTAWMPCLYSAAETVSFCGRMIDHGWMTIAVVDGRVQGFLARDGQEICALYLAPDVQRQGVGRRLLQHAMRHASRLHLRTFVANTAARLFYQRAGFVPVAQGDGSDNDENLPDITYVWSKEAAA